MCGCKKNQAQAQAQQAQAQSVKAPSKPVVKASSSSKSGK